MKEIRNRKTKLKQVYGWALSALILMVGLSPGSQRLSKIPSTIHLTEGYSARLSLPAPIGASVSGGDACALSGMDETLGEADPSYTITGETPGSAKLVLSILGVPLKTVSVNVTPERTVMPGGQSIGVALRMGGALVVGTSDIGTQKSPARAAGLRPGDRIAAVDGTEVSSAEELAGCLNAHSAVLTIERDGQQQFVTVHPIQDGRDGKYRLGAWVRDSTAGVGTLSFYDTESGMFGALGHAITDVDTGTVLPVDEGYIYESRIVDVQMGHSGEPGELLGEFFDEDRQIGSVEKNSEIGLYGQSDEPMLNELYPTGVKLMQRSEIQLGAAKLITTIGGQGMQEYDCEIVKLFHQDAPAPRSMVVKITDERLLSATGGIVQGMSGSPILQDGRLVGAITHVFINDPTQGYGLYAEWMIDQCEAAA